MRALAANPDASIALIHAVTTTVALQSLQPFVGHDDRRLLRTQAWCILASLWSVYGAQPPLDRGDLGDTDAPRSPPVPTWAQLLDAAIAGGDEHNIKLTVAAQCATMWGADDSVARTCVAAIVVHAE